MGETRPRWRMWAAWGTRTCAACRFCPARRWPKASASAGSPVCAGDLPPRNSGRRVPGGAVRRIVRRAGALRAGRRIYQSQRGCGRRRHQRADRRGVRGAPRTVCRLYQHGRAAVPFGHEILRRGGGQLVLRRSGNALAGRALRQRGRQAEGAAAQRQYHLLRGGRGVCVCGAAKGAFARLCRAGPASEKPLQRRRHQRAHRAAAGGVRAEPSLGKPKLFYDGPVPGWEKEGSR